MRKLLFIFLMSYGLLHAQSESELYEKGLLFRRDRDYLNGYKVFQQLLKIDSNNVNYMVQAGFFYSKYGYFLPDDHQKMAHYQVSLRLARRAIRTDSKNADAHYVHAMALGFISSVSGIKGKIDHSKLIKAEIETAIKLDDKHAGAHHLLGRWHSIVSGMNTVERGAMNAFLGGMAKGATYENAIMCFARAITLDPMYKMHMVALAETYYEMGRPEYSKYWIEKAKGMKSRNEDDKVADKKCEELLKKISNER